MDAESLGPIDKHEEITVVQLGDEHFSTDATDPPPLDLFAEDQPSDYESEPDEGGPSWFANGDARDESDNDTALPQHSDKFRLYPGLRQRKPAGGLGPTDAHQASFEYKTQVRYRILRWVRSLVQRLVPKRYAPDWFRQPNLELGDSSAIHWEGFAYLERRWRESKQLRINAAVTLVAVCVFILCWWIVLAPILSSLVLLGRGSGGALYGNVLEGHRIDGFGHIIRSPLPLLDLQFNRKEYGQLRDRLSLLVSRRAETDIRRWWQQTGPPPPAPAPAAEDPDTPPARSLLWDSEPFTTRVPDHRREKLWQVLCRDKAVRSPQGAPVSESVVVAHDLWDGDAPVLVEDTQYGLKLTRPDDAQSFRKATLHWLKRSCAKGGLVDASQFMESARLYATLELDVTDYLSPIPPENLQLYEEPQKDTNERPADEDPDSSPSQDGEGGETPPSRPPPFRTNLADPSSRDIVQDFMNLDNDDEGDDDTGADTEKQPRPQPEAPNPAPDPSSIPMLPQPPPNKAFRNISIAELHEVMAFMASQGMRTRVDKQTAAQLEQQLGHRVADTATGFGAVTQTDPRDPWYPMVRDEMARLQQLRFDALLDLRTAALWSGEGGCVCAHHLGVPINGAGWYEPAAKSRGKVRVLFYPKSDAQTAEAKQGWTHVFPSIVRTIWSGSRKETNIDPQETGGEGTAAPLEWRHADPVFNPLVARESTDEDQATTASRDDILHLPPAAMDQDWTWVEGIDYRGKRRRYPVSPRSLACVQSCNRACGKQSN